MMEKWTFHYPNDRRITLCESETDKMNGRTKLFVLMMLESKKENPVCLGVFDQSC